MLRTDPPFTTLLVATALLLSAIPLGWAASAQSTSCELEASQQMTAGLIGQQVDGVSSSTEPIPEACQGEAFTLEGSNPGDDFDICFNDAAGEQIECSTASGDEAGTIPQEAVEGEITYWAGAAGTYTLTAPVSTLGDDPAQGPVDLYFRTAPTGAGNADTFAGSRTMTTEEPTKDIPSAWHGPWGVDGTAVDPNWVWSPEDGFELEHASVETTFYFTAAGDQPLRGADWEATLAADGETLATVTGESATFLPGEVAELTIPFGDITASGAELSVTIDVVFANEAATAVLYDSVDTPSRLSLGANLEDTTPPGPVEEISATANSPTRISLAWSEATDDSGIDHYIVHRGLDANDLSPVTTTAGTSLVDTELDPSTTYHYKVQAVDIGGNVGPLSDLVAATTLDEDAVEIEPRPFTVVAITDSGFSPYHYDFVGHQHPWNTDDDPANDMDFYANPADYIEGYPVAEPVEITIPTDPDANVDELREADADAWDAMQSSSGSGDGVELHWIPGTKIVGAIQYGDSFVASNSAHGTRSAASAAGNIHGSCQECLFVLIEGLGNAGVTWAAQQPWIDVVSNSWGACAPLTCAARSPANPGNPPSDWQASSEAGQFVVFSAGNGLANAFVAPQASYLNSRNGADWIVTVGAVSPGSKSTYSGSAKPVDISSIGSSYPSTGGSTVTGTGTHSGTSNAAPVTAGYLAKVIQESRELLSDTTPGHAGGILAEGDPVPCGDALPNCPLGDGKLTRSEARDIVYKNVHPSTGQAVGTVWPNTPYNYAYQGHGVLLGHIDGTQAYQDQVDQMVATATGDATFLERPEGETNWFVMDSKCRQHLWGEWDGGYYKGQDPELDPTTDAPAMALDTWCTGVMPEGALR